MARESPSPDRFPPEFLSLASSKAKLQLDIRDVTFPLRIASLDPVQLTQMAKYLETVYVSGWQSSSTASSSLEPGPDLADYPSNTVPLKVAQLFTAQLFHDRKQRFTRLTTPKDKREALGKPVDYLRPIVADADTVSRVELIRIGRVCDVVVL